MMRFQVITSESIVFAQDILSATLSGGAGMIEILPGHAPLVQALSKGTISLNTSEKTVHLAIEEGVSLISSGAIDVFTSAVTLLPENTSLEQEIESFIP